MKKKQPTFEEQLNAAHAQAAAALSVFHDVISDLEDAAADKRRIADEIRDELVKLRELVVHYGDLHNEAVKSEAEHLAKADSIRALVGNN